MKETVVTLLDMDKTDGGPADLLSFYLFDRIFYLRPFSIHPFIVSYFILSMGESRGHLHEPNWGCYQLNSTKI